MEEAYYGLKAAEEELEENVLSEEIEERIVEMKEELDELLSSLKKELDKLEDEN